MHVRAAGRASSRASPIGVPQRSHGSPACEKLPAATTSNVGLFGTGIGPLDPTGIADLAVANLLSSAPGESSRSKLYLNQFVESGNTTVSFAAGVDISPDEHHSRDLAAAHGMGDHCDFVVGQGPNETGQDPRPVWHSAQRRHADRVSRDAVTAQMPDHTAIIGPEKVLQHQTGEKLMLRKLFGTVLVAICWQRLPGDTPGCHYYRFRRFARNTHGQ